MDIKNAIPLSPDRNNREIYIFIKKGRTFVHRNHFPAVTLFIPIKLAPDLCIYRYIGMQVKHDGE